MAWVQRLKRVFRPADCLLGANIPWERVSFTRSVGARAARGRNKSCPFSSRFFSSHSIFPAVRRQGLAILAKLFGHGLLPGGPMRVWRFLCALAACTPRAWPQVVSDWIAGLAIQDYIKRYFAIDATRERRVTQTTLELLRRTYATYLERGDLEVSLADSATRLMVTLRGAIEPRFYRHAARRFEKLLRTTAGTLTLRIEELSERQLDRHLHQLLRRLSRYGDRVSLHLDHRIQPLLKMDLSKFHLVLDEGVAPASTAG